MLEGLCKGTERRNFREERAYDTGRGRIEVKYRLESNKGTKWSPEWDIQGHIRKAIKLSTAVDSKLG